jgi:S1-C subfamily serine protease
MKRFSKILAVLLILSVIPVSAATYTLVKANYPILINGQNLAVQPLNYNGTTYLPLRSISEAVGVPIEWTGQSVEIQTVDVDRLKEACVMIDAQSSTKASQGSAVCWDYGEYLTANHVVDNGKTHIVSDIDFSVDGTNSQLDIATLDTDDKTKPVKIGDSDEVKVGDTVILISSPNWKENTVSYGEVEINSTWIIVNGESDGGSSGGAAFNTKGELIGVLISGDTRIGEYCIVPINDIREAF